MGAAYVFTVYVLLINYDVIKVVELCSETSFITYTKVRRCRRLLSEKCSRQKPKNTKANGKFFFYRISSFQLSNYCRQAKPEQLFCFLLYCV